MKNTMKKKKLENLGDFETRIIQYTKIAIGIIGLILFSIFLFK